MISKLERPSIRKGTMVLFDDISLDGDIGHRMHLSPSIHRFIGGSECTVIVTTTCDVCSREKMKSYSRYKSTYLRMHRASSYFGKYCGDGQTKPGVTLALHPFCFEERPTMRGS